MPMITNTIFDEWLTDTDPDSPTMKELFDHSINHEFDTMVSYGRLVTHPLMNQMITFADMCKKQQDDKLLLKDLLSRVSIQQVKLNYDSVYQIISNIGMKNLNDRIYCIDTLPNINVPYLLSDYLLSFTNIRDIVSEKLKFDTTGYHINDDFPCLWHYIKMKADRIKGELYDEQ